MRTLNRLGAALSLLLLPLGSGLASADHIPMPRADFSFISIDPADISGQLRTRTLEDVNNAGAFAGGSAGSTDDGFVLLRTFVARPIKCPAIIHSPSNAQPQAINTAGAIAGFCAPGGNLRGFLRSSTGQYTMLTVPASTLTEAVGLNDLGQVVGDYRDSAGRFHGFIWEAGVFTTLDPPFPPVAGAALTGINNREQSVGVWDHGSGGRFGFVHDPDFGFLSLEFPHSAVTAPVDINSAGQIVGVFVEEGGSTAQSFILDHGRFKRIAPLFPNVTATIVNGINNRGQIVGIYRETVGSEDLFHGFIATPASAPVPNLSLAKSLPMASLQGRPEPSRPAREDEYPIGKWNRPLY